MRQSSNPSDDFDSVLDDFGRRPSAQKRIFYFLLALLVAVVPAILCVRIFVVDVTKAQLTIYTGVLLSAVILSLSYHNLAFSQAARIRADATAPTKNSFRGKKDLYEKAMKAHESRISSSALAYSFAYNNAIFLLSAPFIASYICADKVSGELNALCSGAAAAGLALFNSRSALKAIGE